MSVSATLTMLVSTTSRSAPSATAAATSHLLTAGAARAGPSKVVADVAAVADMGVSFGFRGSRRLVAGVDREVDAQAGAQRAVRRQVGDGDADRHALHDLGEVAGGVVGRQQREA